MCKKNDEGKIYKTTDGFFTYNDNITKKRLVTVVHQREDRAVTVAKLHSKSGKQGNSFIEGLSLSPLDHPSLNEETIIANSLIYGRKSKEGTKTKIMPDDMIDTGDKLKCRELRIVKKKRNADTIQHKKTRDKTLYRWKNFFKK